jgi:hypothetical protein
MALPRSGPLANCDALLLPEFWTSRADLKSAYRICCGFLDSIIAMVLSSSPFVDGAWNTISYRRFSISGSSSSCEFSACLPLVLAAGIWFAVLFNFQSVHSLDKIHPLGYPIVRISHNSSTMYTEAAMQMSCSESLLHCRKSEAIRRVPPAASVVAL